MNATIDLKRVSDLHLSNNNGIGKSSDIGLDLTQIDYLTYIYKGVKLHFFSAEQKECIFQILFHNANKSKAREAFEKYVEHIGSGDYLTLTHTAGTSKVSVDILGTYRDSISLLGLVSVEKVSKNSKLLSCYFKNADKTTKQALQNLGVVVHKPVVNDETLTVDGFIIELAATTV